MLRFDVEFYISWLSFYVEVEAAVEVEFEVEFEFGQNRLKSFGGYHVPAMHFWPRITCQGTYLWALHHVWHLLKMTLSPRREANFRISLFSLKWHCAKTAFSPRREANSHIRDSEAYDCDCGEPIAFYCVK